MVRELRARLPASVFEPRTRRLAWLPVHVAIIAASTALVARGAPWWLALLASLSIGLSFAGLAFVGHEALHGALVRGARLRRWVGFLGFLPFCVAPRLWIAWHNRVHHGATNHPGRDPDALATLSEYRTARAVRWLTDVQRFSRCTLTLLFGFSLQSAHVLLVARSRGYLVREHARSAYLVTAAGVAFWALWGVLLGPRAFVYCYVLPLLVANVVVMAHILTNHGLSPLDDDNDPLKSSLSVRVPRWFSFYTLDFGYHVEHHLLPGVSQIHGRRIQALLREKYPRRYQELPLLGALVRVCRAPRVYADAETLLDPHTGQTQKTLGALAPEQRSTSQPPPSAPSSGQPSRKAALGAGLRLTLPRPSPS